MSVNLFRGSGGPLFRVGVSAQMVWGGGGGVSDQVVHGRRGVNGLGRQVSSGAPLSPPCSRDGGLWSVWSRNVNWGIGLRGGGGCLVSTHFCRNL